MRFNWLAILAIGFLLTMLLPGLPLLTAESTVIRVPDDYLRIQHAIDNADSGDTILIAAGTYRENLVIREPLRLIGDGADKTVVVSTESVLRVEASNVEIQGLSLLNGTYGIVLWHSQNVSLRDNTMSNNRWNFAVWGDSTAHFLHDIDSSNIVDGKPMYFWINRHEQQVPTDAGYVALINCTNITVKSLELTSNEQGILLVSTTDSIIEEVTMRGNDEGMDIRTSYRNIIRKNRLLVINWRAIYLGSSDNNTFYQNTLVNCTYGLSIQDSNGNTFYHNNFIDSIDQVYIEGSQNIWHNDLQEGNYWSDYVGEDVDDDGVGDTDLPWQGVDYYPLMEVFEQAVINDSLILWFPIVGLCAAAMIIIVLMFWGYKSHRRRQGT